MNHSNVRTFCIPCFKSYNLDIIPRVTTALCLDNRFLSNQFYSFQECINSVFTNTYTPVPISHGNAKKREIFIRNFLRPKIRGHFWNTSLNFFPSLRTIFQVVLSQFFFLLLATFISIFVIMITDFILQPTKSYSISSIS